MLRVTPPYVMAASNCVAPTWRLVVPTHRDFCVEIPPAVVMLPVLAEVASVVSVELTPALKMPVKVCAGITHETVRVPAPQFTALPEFDDAMIDVRVNVLLAPVV